ncbi:BRID5 protein, partial [Crypturellus undulatus]|nr:BRID5 protein [Crypturellus undulatus]
LCVALFFAVVGISVAGVLGFSRSSAQRRSQAVRLALQGQPGTSRNQSAVVDRARSTVTFYVTSQSTGSAAVLYDGENGHVCYKPTGQRVCYLRAMDTRDRQHLQAALNASEHAAEPLHSDQTKRSREFLAVQAGAEVDPAGLGPAVRTLCERRSILPARRSPGPGRQRLIYLCIDICFPSNICVSICFYYLPE